MYELFFHPLLSCLLDFSNSLASKWNWKLLYAPMGDLTSFCKPAFLLFRIASLCIRTSHVFLLLFEKPINSQGWILYTYSIQISVLLQFQSPLVWILHVWLAILWVLLFYHLGSISTFFGSTQICLVFSYNIPLFSTPTKWKYWNKTWDNEGIDGK